MSNTAVEIMLRNDLSMQYRLRCYHTAYLHATYQKKEDSFDMLNEEEINKDEDVDGEDNDIHQHELNISPDGVASLMCFTYLLDPASRGLLHNSKMILIYDIFFLKNFFKMSA